ncbi:low-temperature viability LTV1 [Purpureocillium lavendulum]|uniref:Mitochondrial import inner membrane translocase subunit TIM50 n=1 Tax=Purpureocillium lavendulum TaxID=1247861 RepID=A0AB34FJ23_9HYPO|nr:low-temperature viability LTV1 [Purpureocillium lavendulum]
MNYSAASTFPSPFSGQAGVPHTSTAHANGQQRAHPSQPHYQSQVQQPGIPGLTLLEAMAQAQPPPRGSAPTLPVANELPQSCIRRKPKANKALPAPPPPAVPASKAQDEARDPRVAPSASSGGIPDPTPLYLAQSFAPPSTLLQPRRILVILDLNGTLLFRPTRRQPTRFVERPHARAFLDYCLDTFYLAVWSSARPENVARMLDQLLTDDQRRRCVVVWGRDRFGLSNADYNTRVQCYKRLTTVWNDKQVRASHPHAARGGRWDQSNTVLVDDSLEKGRSEPHNILTIPEFSGMSSETVDVLPQVHDYLNLLCHQADISRYMHQTPFKLDPNYHLPPAVAGGT